MSKFVSKYRSEYSINRKDERFVQKDGYVTKYFNTGYHISNGSDLSPRTSGEIICRDCSSSPKDLLSK